MKKSLILCFITLLSSPFVMADQSINFPENAPQLDVAFPDDWELKPKDGVLFAHPKDDSNFFMELSKLEADKDHPDEAMEEAKASVFFKVVVAKIMLPPSLFPVLVCRG